jgi:hypothetical protein
VTGHPLELPGDIDELPYLRVDLVRLAELRRLLERLVEGDVEGVGDEPGHAVGLGVGQAERTANVADRRLRPQRTEGDDLGHAVVPVPLVGETDHLVATVVGEVEVDVRHLATLQVQEALEDQPVRHGVDVGDAEAVEDEGSRRRAAHAHADALLAGVVGDLLDDINVVVNPVCSRTLSS